MAGRDRINEVQVKGKRHYELPNGDTVPSVTTFLDVLPKEALHKWKTKTAARWAVQHQNAWSELPIEAAVDVIAASPFYDSSARDNGDIAHRILEEMAIGRDPTIPQGFEGARDVWHEFTSDFDVKVVYAEPQLINYTYRYSGSADLICEIDGELCLVDHKSGNGIYGSTAFQLTAYGMCEKLMLPDGEEIDMPEVTSTYALWVRPNGYALYPMAFDQDTWDTVRAARRVFDLTRDDWRYRGKPVNPNPVKRATAQWGETKRVEG